MFQDILRDSWVYQEIGKEALEKGLEQGLAKGAEQTLLAYIQARFPALVILASQRIGAISEPEELNHIINTLFTLQTAEEVERFLLSLDNSATKN